MDKLSQLIGDLSIDEAIEYGQGLVDGGISFHDYQQKIIDGLSIVGEKYEDGQCFIADLIISGMLARDLFALMKENMKTQEDTVRGRVIIGTICGDIHDIGKNLIADALHYRGIEVIDLGVDVPIDDFINAVEQYRPDILAVSTIMDNRFIHVNELVSRLKEAGYTDDMKIVVGGTAADPRYVTIEGVDCYTNEYHIDLNYIIDELGRKYKGLESNKE